MRMIIQFQHEDVMEPKPWPVVVDENWEVTSGLGYDDGSFLLGFGPAGEQEITVYPRDVVKNPKLAEGLTATFSGKDGKFFLWNIPVASVGIV